MAKSILVLEYPVKTYEQITLTDAAAKALTASYIGKGGVILQPEGGAIRWRADASGSSVSATSGFVLEDGATLRLNNATSATRFYAIPVGGEDVILNVAYLR